MRLKRLKRALLGENPRGLAYLLVPTGLALLLDLLLRGRVLVGYAPQGKAIYGSSLLVSAGFWVLPLWLGARLYSRATSDLGGRGRIGARAGFLALLVLWLLPFATFSYGGQPLYHRVVHAYMGRDTVRLGFALRGTLGDWFKAWSSALGLVAMLVTGIVVTACMFVAMRRAAPLFTRRWPPILPAFAFFGALFTFWIDMVDSRFLQAALPDVCFVHGAVHAAQVGITGKGTTRRGVSLRTPVPLPPLVSTRATKPNVLLILTESVRADAICSEPTPSCRAKFLDDVVPDRISLGKLTTPSPGTFGACVLLWTGLPAIADVKTAHSAPVLWELAHAVGYRTSYVTSQNLQFENLSAFVQRAGIDTLVTATELGGLKQEQLGAPDERATEEMLRVVRATPEGTPYFGLVHLSNTHAPYRIDPGLAPFEPQSDNLLGDPEAFHNRYRNSVALQERTVAAFLRELRALPSWENTVVLFVSDHGEQFRERGGLYHLHSVYDEEVRVPGFMVGGASALDADMRAALKTFATHRTYLADVNATIVDLFGLGAAHASLPFANPQARSMLTKWSAEPITLLTTSTAVWHEDDPRNGVMAGELLLMGGAAGPTACFNMVRDPGQRDPLDPARCGRRMLTAAEAFSR